MTASFRLLRNALVVCTLLGTFARAQPGPPSLVDVAAHERARVLKGANAFLTEAPITITAFKAENSTGAIPSADVHRTVEAPARGSGDDRDPAQHAGALSLAVD